MKRKKIAFFAAAVLSVVFFSACETTKQKKEPDPARDRVPQSSQNRSSWEKIQEHLKRERQNRRPTRGDINTFQNDKLQVYPGRSGSRSESLYKNDNSVFKLW